MIKDRCTRNSSKKGWTEISTKGLKDSNFYGVLNGQNTKKTTETHTTQAPEDRYSLGATETYKGVEGWTL